jgi:hypothetical protein
MPTLRQKVAAIGVLGLVHDELASYHQIPGRLRRMRKAPSARGVGGFSGKQSAPRYAVPREVDLPDCAWGPRAVGRDAG